MQNSRSQVPPNENKPAPSKKVRLFTPIGRKHYSISFSLPTDVIEALNEKCGNTKGARSEYASQVLARALGLPIV